MLDGSSTLKKEGYNPSYFLQMGNEHGGVEAVRLLLKAKDYQTGLTTLWEMQRLDMSGEAAILQKKYTSLFTETEKREARRRLKAMNYVPKVD
jgi:hypothetical protein